jgi:hypothetical protein
MSEPRVAALVCEGQTDVPVFEALIQELWPSVDEVRVLQPEVDEHGRSRGRAGWSEVKTWCEQNASDLGALLDPPVGDRIDLLLVAIDVDVAIAAGIANPPREVGAYESARLQQTLRGWLKPRRARNLPPEVVVSTPVMAVEAWIIAAIFPRRAAPEALRDPAEFLVEKRKLRRSAKDEKPWKELHRYRDFATKVAARLDRVRRSCPEAERTCRAIEQLRDAVEAQRRSRLRDGSRRSP